MQALFFLRKEKRWFVEKMVKEEYYEKESIMKCPNCGKEMRDGYLFCSKDGAFSFANEVPGVFENAKNADGFVKITELKPSHRTHIKAAICEACRKVVLDY